MSSDAVVPEHDAIRQFRAYRRSLGRTPRLHRDTITLRGLQFAVFHTDDPQTGALPLICVNGGLIFDHALLWPALSPLAAGRRLIFYDQRGRGASAVPPGARASRVEFDAVDLAALPAALGISRCHLLGHSWGGGLAMLSTRTASAHLASLTLINAVGLTSDWLPTLTPAAVRRLTPTQRKRLLAADAAIQPDALRAADPTALSEYAAAIYPAWFAQPELASILSPPQSTSIAGAAVSARLRRDGYDWRQLVPPAAMPTLLLHGTADLFPLDIARDTLAVLGANASLQPIDGAGHNPFWEQPSIVFSSIDAFLTAADRFTS